MEIKVFLYESNICGNYWHRAIVVARNEKDALFLMEQRFPPSGQSVEIKLLPDEMGTYILANE